MVFDICQLISDKLEVDYPLCEQCTEQYGREIRARLDEETSQKVHYQDLLYLLETQKPEEDQRDIQAEIAQVSLPYFLFKKYVKSNKRLRRIPSS